MSNAGSMVQKLDALSDRKAKLFELLLEKRSETQSIRPYPRSETSGTVLMPTSLGQERLWFIDQLEGAGAAYNIPMVARLRGRLNRDALRRSLDSLVKRHEVLRTVFVSVDGSPRQAIAPEGRFSLHEYDLCAYAEASRCTVIEAHRAEEARVAFDLARGPLIRGRLLQLHPEDHLLLLTMHHIICDGWSMGVMLNELEQLYTAFLNERADLLKPLPLQYADYAQWQREWLHGGILDEQLNYWRTHLDGAPPELRLPIDRPRPAAQSYSGATIPVVFDEELTTGLHALARVHGMTLFMVLYAGWALLLSRLSGQEDVVIGTPIANRRRPELEALLGLFVNTLVLRVQASADLPLNAFLGRVKEVTVGAYDHQDTPFERLVDVLRPERSLSYHPVFQAMLVLQNAPRAEMGLPDVTVTFEDAVSDTSKFDLLLSLQEQEGRISGSLNYNTDIFERATIDRWIASFNVLLRAMPHANQERISALPILTDLERRQVTEQFNASRMVNAGNRHVHELFEEQVRRSPGAIAVSHGARSLTYAELNQRANQLARSLRANGIVPDRLVAICVDRCLEMVIGLLGTLKAGGAYLPLDPNYPLDRLHYMLEQAGPTVVLTQKELRRLVPAISAEVIDIHDKLIEIGTYATENLSPFEVALSPNNLVYVIYTSGSTGRPKGTAMRHGAMVNLIEWHRDNLPCAADERVLQFAALSFDVAFQEIFSTLCTGGTLVLLDDWIRKDTPSLAELLNEQAITRLFIPPVMLESLAQQSVSAGSFPRRLRDVITAGEQLRISPDIMTFFTKRRGCRLHNHYGPTETHVVTALTLPDSVDAWPTLPTIGRPIANTQIYILDSRGEPQPIGVVGEIYIGGASLALGYLKQPEMTAERFVRDAFSDAPQVRLYRTGDLGRWRADGSIEFLGRNDDQVKIRGHRIELGEIEARLGHHSKIKEVAVVAREDAAGGKRLVAYVTPRDGLRLTSEELREYLKGMLPEHMVPSAFVTMESLPLTPSGKVNRRALPPTDFGMHTSADYDAPKGRIEETIARVWKDLLQVEQVGRQDSFFELGGHSLLVLKALSKINDSLGSGLKVTDVYRSPTLAELAARIVVGRNEDRFVDLSLEAAVDSAIIPIAGAWRKPPAAVLLTGGTGFCGRFLLAQLLHGESATVYCLVRAASQKEATSRLRKMLLQWDLWRDEFESRVVAIPGDLRLPRLGIDERSYEHLSSEIDSIYHCGTSMNHLETYSMAKPANVESATALLKLATHRKPKLVNYISSLSVFRASGATARLVNEESSIDNERHRESSGYAASKWVGERIFMTASERGIPCNIFRVGFVWADSKKGRYDELQRGYRILKSCLLSGHGIRNFRYHSPPTPVDYVARAIVTLANEHSDGRGIFHISSPEERIHGLFERCNEIAGTDLELSPYYEWVSEMKRLHDAGWSLPIVPLIESSFSLDEASFYERERHAQSENVPFDCTRTHRQLEQAGIVAPVLDDRLLTLCIESMVARDVALRERFDDNVRRRERVRRDGPLGAASSIGSM